MGYTLIPPEGKENCEATAKWKSRNTKIAKVNELIRPLADGKSVVWFDVASKFFDAEGQPDITLLPDGTHPGPQGYAVWADALLPYLKETCGK